MLLAQSPSVRLGAHELLIDGREHLREDAAALSLIYDQHLRLQSPPRPDDRLSTVALSPLTSTPLHSFGTACRPELFQHSSISLAADASPMSAPSRELPVELPHQRKAEPIIRSPQICHYAPRTGYQEWSYQTRNSLLTVTAPLPVSHADSVTSSAARRHSRISRA